jgi:murein DD-endopeptidase MepM/ murein hydrolase activator NlpD
VRDAVVGRLDIGALPARTRVTAWIHTDSEGAKHLLGGTVELQDDDARERAALAPLVAADALAPRGPAPQQPPAPRLSFLRTRVDDPGTCLALGSRAPCMAHVDEDGVLLHSGLRSRPLEHVVVSSPVGERVHPISRRRRFHAGTDYAAPLHTPIVAVAPGVVVEVRRSWSAGRLVTIRHDNGETSRHFHLHRQLVKKGQRVASGDPIGTVGLTGRTTGPHLHFELRDATGRPIDATRLQRLGRARLDAAGTHDVRTRLTSLRLPRLLPWATTLQRPPHDTQRPRAPGGRPMAPLGPSEAGVAVLDDRGAPVRARRRRGLPPRTGRRASGR